MYHYEKHTLFNISNCSSFFFYNCSEDEAHITEKITTDISVTSSQNLINWTDSNNLTLQLNNALTYSNGVAPESKILKQQNYNADTTQVTATISFKAAFQSKYTDTNTSNNTTTVNLVKNVETQGVVLNADEPGDTYALITSVLAPGFDPIETPDCSHNAFGDHIDELFDTDLNSNVFRFYIHNTR